jgi:Sigma54-dependent transcription regulator containing an AAA-type ATPase domain and a DNA-binding domain
MVEYKIKSISHQALCFQSISDLALSNLLLFWVKYTNTLLCLYSLKEITCFVIVHMSYTYCAWQFVRAVMNEVRRVPFIYFSIFPPTTPLLQEYLCFQMHCSRTIYYHPVALELSSGFIEYREEINRRQRTRQRTYLHSTDMRYQPSYSVYRSEPVRAFSSRYAPPHKPPSKLFVVDPPEYEIASNFARRRYDSNVRLSVKLETRQPRYNRTHKKVRFDDSRYECEIRYPAQSLSRGYEPEFRYSQYASRGPRFQNTWDSNPADIRYETREPKVIHHGLHEMSGSGRRLLRQRRQRGRGPSLWF